MEATRILCSANCKHNGGEGYYGLCQHPLNQNRAPYGGITRMYMEKCDLQESENSDQEVKLSG